MPFHIHLKRDSHETTLDPSLYSERIPIHRRPVIALNGVSDAPSDSSPVGDTPPQQSASVSQEEFTLLGGDTIRIVFPGTPNLDTTQQIRRDGRINLLMIGEVVAAGKTRWH